ncbi:MAG: peroxiredoxin [Rhodospirillales bacterium]|nr:peroxiredoxin [Rhodospirillales bacterium]USO08393.1 MAG: peroxiredoxin [Rhodospirillales bacterium]
MTEIGVNDKAPDFRMEATGGTGKGAHTLSLKDFTGKALVLYFYPKDDTPGCTSEACGFRDDIARFGALDAAIVGVSRDDIKLHEKFAKKYDLNFPLASDADGKACAAYGVWKEKSMYGRKYMGIERSTFLIDGQGKIAGVWRNVKVPGHVEDVAAAIVALNARP